MTRVLTGGPQHVLADDLTGCGGNAPSSNVFDGRTTSWSADGTRVLYSYTVPDGSIDWHDYEFVPGETVIEEFDLAAPYPDIDSGSYDWPPEGARPLARFKPAMTPHVDYAPLRDNYVFASDAGTYDGKRRLYVYNRAGTYKKRLTSDAYVTFPVFSPDNKYVLYAQKAPGTAWKLKRVTLGSTAAPIMVLLNALQPDWQPVP